MYHIYECMSSCLSFPSLFNGRVAFLHVVIPPLLVHFFKYSYIKTSIAEYMDTEVQLCVKKSSPVLYIRAMGSGVPVQMKTECTRLYIERRLNGHWMNGPFRSIPSEVPSHVPFRSVAFFSPVPFRSVFLAPFYKHVMCTRFVYFFTCLLKAFKRNSLFLRNQDTTKENSKNTYYAKVSKTKLWSQS